MQPIRVAQFVTRLRRGGIESWILNVAKSADQSRCAIAVITCGSNDPKMVAELRQAGAVLYEIPPVKKFWQFAFSLRNVLREGNFQIIHCNSHWANALVLIVAMGITRGRISHARSDTRVKDRRSSFPRKGYIWLMRALMRFSATHFLAISEKAGTCMFGRNKRFRIIESGIDFAPFDVTKDTTIRRALGFSSDDWIVGHIGRLERPKNHGFLLEAFARLTREEPRARLLLVGDGPERVNIEHQIYQAKLQDRVVLLGERLDVPNLLVNVIDVLAFPSLWEGYGRAVVEAQAANIPSVCSNAIAPEAVIIDELVDIEPLSTPEAFARRLLDSRSRPRVSQRKVLSVLRRHPISMERNIACLMQFYEEILETNQDTGPSCSNG